MIVVKHPFGGVRQYEVKQPLRCSSQCQFLFVVGSFFKCVHHDAVGYPSQQAVGQSLTAVTSAFPLVHIVSSLALYVVGTFLMSIVAETVSFRFFEFGGKTIQFMVSHGSAVLLFWMHIQAALHHIAYTGTRDPPDVAVSFWSVSQSRGCNVQTFMFRPCRIVRYVVSRRMHLLQFLLEVFTLWMVIRWTSTARLERPHYCTVCNLIVNIFSCCLFTVWFSSLSFVQHLLIDSIESSHS